MEWPFRDLEEANEEITELRRQIVELTEKIEYTQKITQELMNLAEIRTRMYDELRDKHTRLIGGLLELKAKYGGEYGGEQDED